VVVTWGPGEQALAAQVWRAGMVPELLPLGRLIALVREAELVIAADTGVLHLGAMIGTPTVGIYGPKDARVHGPRSRHGEVVVSTAPCSPCRLRVCEHRICMALIPPEEVSASVARVLEAARAGVAAP
jgi:ADP-heptose:LPS heptosyltransferase